MRCSKVQPLLAEHIDGLLGLADSERVEAHLDGCAGCRREADALERSLGALDRVANSMGNGSTPDLWASFAARVGTTVSCDEVRLQLPAYLDGAVAGPPLSAIGFHVEGCAACSAELAGYRTAVEALERVGEQVQAPDLWPEFEARLAEERVPRGWLAAAVSRARAAVQEALAPLCAPAFRPALAAAAVLAVFGLTQFLSPTRDRSAQPPQVAVQPAPAPADEPESSPAPERLKPAPPVRVDDASVIAKEPLVAPAIPSPGVVVQRSAAKPEKSQRSRSHKSVVARAGRGESAARPVEVEKDSPTAPKARSWASQLQVAYNPSLKEPDVVTGTNPGARSQSQVMPEVVHAVELLAEVEDAAIRPFEAGPDVP